MLKRTALFLLLITLYHSSRAQITREVLFLGNSYTAANGLGALVQSIALSFGDTLVYQAYTPGGYTLEGHSTNMSSISNIQSNPWDYVVLQEQSQKPSFPPGQVAVEVYPFADSLNRIIEENNFCTRTMFFMTWGRENGDASNCPFYTPLCTYDGMQARLRESYVELAQLNQAEVAPVGAAWKVVRDSFPSISLYSADGSHPNLSGSYLAACVFYASIYHKSPVGGNAPGSLLPADVLLLQQTAEHVVLDSLPNWFIDTLSYPLTIPQNVSICQGETWTGGGGVQTETGMYIDTLVAVNGCDSIVQTALWVAEQVTDTLVVQVCSGETWFAGGALQTTSGVYTDTFPSSMGCDSVLITQLTMLPTAVDSLEVGICEGESWWAAGQFQTISGDYSDTLATAEGCDSIVVTLLSVSAFIPDSQAVFICQGESWNAGGQWQTTSGVYQDTLVGDPGCDTLLITTLSVLNIASDTAWINLCSGDSVFVSGEFQFDSGIYVDSLQTILGCDSLLYNLVEVSPLITDTMEAIICEGETWVAGGMPQSTSGWYIDTYLSVQGCDSILNTHLVVQDGPDTPDIIQVGSDSIQSSIEGDAYYWAGDGLPLADTDSSVMVSFQCDVEYTLIVYDNGCLSSTSDTFMQSCTGMEEKNRSLNISLFPTPSTGKVMLEVTSGAETYFGILVYDLAGKIQKEFKEVGKSPANLDLSSLKSGIYWVKIIVGDYTIVKKIVLQQR